ncbi:putative ribonuclease H protein [Glycine max]|nr:putative ribonuclease H protein [Glycine max]
MELSEIPSFDERQFLSYNKRQNKQSDKLPIMKESPQEAINFSAFGTTDQWKQIAANYLNCSLLALPFVYLGIPIGANPRRDHLWESIIQKCERKLVRWKQRYISFGGRVTLIQSGASNSDGQAMCLPKDKGGLGIKDINTFNLTLLGKWMWHLLQHQGKLWARVLEAKYGGWRGLDEEGRSNLELIWWKDLKRAIHHSHHGKVLQNGLKWKVEVGDKIKFWEDGWICQEESLFEKYPRLYMISSQQHQLIRQLGKHKDSGWEWNFNWRRPLFDSEIDLAITFLSEVEGKSIQHHGSDDWEWTEDPSGIYSTHSAYSLFWEEAAARSQEDCFEELWKIKIPSKTAIFADVLTEQIQEIAPRCMLFADDIVLLGESREELNERLETWRRALETHGFRLSRSKSEYMECKFNKRRRVSNSEVKIGDHIIPQVTRFKYLGSVIQDDGEIEGDVNHRIQAGWMKWRKAFGGVPIKLKGKFYRTAVRPAILYGTECWAVKSQHENKVGVAEMRMLRWMCGKTRQDKIRNEAIRERVGVAPIVEKMVENRFRWFGHVERRPVDSVVRRVDQMERRQTIRGRGRPKKTIREVIKKDLEINGLDRSMVLDRTLWRNKTAIFAWRLFRERLPTKINLRARQVQILDMTCPFCRRVEEDASHLFIHCIKIQPIWWETMSWINIKGAFPLNTKHHFLQHSFLQVEGIRVKRILFSDATFDGNKLFEDATFLMWTWLCNLEKDFTMHFNQWSSNLRQGFLQQ